MRGYARQFRVPRCVLLLSKKKKRSEKCREMNGEIKGHNLGTNSAIKQVVLCQERQRPAQRGPVKAVRQSPKFSPWSQTSFAAFWFCSTEWEPGLEALGWGGGRGGEEGSPSSAVPKSVVVRVRWSVGVLNDDLHTVLTQLCSQDQVLVFQFFDLPSGRRTEKKAAAGKKGCNFLPLHQLSTGHFKAA